MTTEQTAQQLELAAQILRTGHPFMVSPKPNGLWCVPTQAEMNVLKWPVDKYEIRPVLATPPDNRPLHNPDNLTAEQVGVGYRLLLPVELDGRHKKACEVWNGKNDWSGEHLAFARYKFLSYRLPLSVPWPEVEKPDPYAELKAAHAAGRVVQVIDCGSWLDLPTPNWCEPVGRYRIKPEPADPYAELKAAHAAGKVIQYRATRGDWSDWPKDQTPDWLALNTLWRVKPEPAFQLPPAPPGMRWHRDDGWTADDLSQGYRPLVVGEKYVSGDEYRTKYSKDWHPETFLGTHTGSKEVTQSESSSLRTTRPLTFTHAGKTWTWHRPGDPMPCDGDRDVCCLVTKGCHRETNPTKGRYMAWSVTDENLHFWGVILGWRYTDEKKTVPLGPEDVPPGSVLSLKPPRWFVISGVCDDGVYILDDEPLVESLWKWHYLAEKAQINRSLPLTGKWNPEAWEPCSKTIPADDNLAEPKSR